MRRTDSTKAKEKKSNLQLFPRPIRIRVHHRRRIRCPCRLQYLSRPDARVLRPLAKGANDHERERCAEDHRQRAEYNRCDHERVFRLPQVRDFDVLIDLIDGVVKIVRVGRGRIGGGQVNCVGERRGRRVIIGCGGICRGTIRRGAVGLVGKEQEVVLIDEAVRPVVVRRLRLISANA